MNQTTESTASAAPTCSASDTPETDATWEAYQRDFTSDAGDPWGFASRLERERDGMVVWIAQAAPMLDVAFRIIIEDSFHRLDEIAGCRGVLESCPVILSQNASVVLTGDHGGPNSTKDVIAG